MSIFNNLLGCACSPPQQDDDSSSHREFNNVERDVRGNTDRIKRLESRLNMRVEALESKIDLRIEMLGNKIDNVLLILNHTNSPATNYKSIM